MTARMRRSSMRLADCVRVPLGLPSFDEWSLRAVCRGKTDKRDENGDDLWHPEKQKDAALGKHICQTQCPVRAVCLAWALANDIGQGTWGGMDQWERKEHRRRYWVN